MLIGWMVMLLSLFASCKYQQVSDDPTLCLRFSVDSISFDTVFSTIGSSTQRIMVYNDNKNALILKKISWKGAPFYINLDGENKIEHLHDIKLNGGDSLFLFVRVSINPQEKNQPVLIVDTLCFEVNGHLQRLPMQAFGQDVEIIKSESKRSDISGDFTFTNTKPYLIFDTLCITGKTIIEAGATIYMHHNANLHLYGDLEAIGQQEHPIRILGDRLDRLFENVPYAYASGQWGGIYLWHEKGTETTNHELDYVDILSGSIGLYCYNEDQSDLCSIKISNSRIHNQALYGLVMVNANAEVYNNEISNAASYSLFIGGGKYRIVHNTIAAFFGYPYTTINLHNVARSDVAAVYIYNQEDDEVGPTSVEIYNNIIVGANQNNLVTDTTENMNFTADIAYNYLKADSITTEWGEYNTYATEADSVLFRNIYYLYKEYNYYDFRLLPTSPARFIADSTLSVTYPTDRQGNARPMSRPDAGCYQYIEE
ncbi:MAG: hypothetical protein MJZ82_04695 [Paludibacteraceae bacterium]|nr:hypothetical protein [Paludibacteraceae bacterium]